MKLLKAAANNPVTSRQISAEMQMSTKTIRNDIKALNEILVDYGIHIDSYRGKGYRLSMKEETAVEQFFQEYTEGALSPPAEPEERIIFIMEKLLLSSEYVKMEDLATKLFVSRSTLQSDLKAVRHILKDYRLAVDHKPNYGIKVTGKETQIRFCISEYIFNQKPIPLEEHWLNLLPFQVMEIIRESILKHLRADRIIISDNSLQNLLTHIVIAYKRICDNQTVRMVKRDFHEIKNEKDFLVAQKILNDIEQHLEVQFSENEIAYLSLHLKGTKLSSSVNQSYDVHSLLDRETQVIVGKMVQRIDREYGLRLSGDQELFKNLSLHLEPAITRSRYQMNVRNPMLGEIRMKYPLSFEAALTAADVINERQNIKVNEDEIGYIALHLEAAQERAKSSVFARNRCLIVCASGLGSAQLLLYKLKNKFGAKLDIIGTIENYNLNNQSAENVDFIISTIPIEKTLSVPIIKVSTILGDNDVSAIEHVLDKPSTDMEKYIIPEYTFLNRDFQTPESVIRFLTETLIKDGKANKEYTRSVLERENLAPTCFGNLVALPHPLEPGTEKTFLAIATLKRPIKWADKLVQLVILLNANKAKKEDLKPMFHSLGRLTDDQQVVSRLLDCKTFAELYETIITF
ncbi:BglG family transcription antiterminator [Lentibacillus amyloliquefaciens]|nr:BglG family transcription antiterminator [Lentibacillus amyloliquefaciens]